MGASLGLAACGGGSGGSSGGSSSSNDTPSTDFAAYGWDAVKELKISNETVGTGAQADATKTVQVHYTGWIYDVRKSDTKGPQFDTSQGKAPLKFKLGAKEVIAGFDQGTTGMKVGGKRTVTLPASLAYGSAGAGAIPPNAALVFDIELVSVN